MQVGLDIGYSYVKVVAGPGPDARWIFPSIVGDVQESRLSLSRNGPHPVKLAGESYFVGNDALNYSRQAQRHQDRAWLDRPAYLALALAGLAYLTPATRCKFQIATGLPVNLFRIDKSKQAQVLRDVHNVEALGRNYGQHFEVDQIVQIPQGLASILAEALDWNGRIVNQDLRSGRVGLINIGGYNVNLATFEDMRNDVPALSTSIDDAGIWSALKDVQSAIADRFGRTVENHHLIPIATEGSFKHFGEQIDVSGIVAKALDPLTRRIEAAITQVWGNEIAGLTALLVAGGGAKLIGPTIVERYAHARIVAEPQFADAVGYYKVLKLLG
jgi:plasmid segregation protein ParM